MPFLVQTLDAFNHGKLDTETATQLLSVSRAHLFRLRALWLRHPTTFALQLSGGNHHPAWPEEVRQFLAAFLPLQRPPNYQLVADELADRFGFERDRKSVAAYARTHFPLLVNAPAPIPKPRRRWQRARVGELWQHDSSIHQWWPASDKQTLLLRVDDHSRKLVERKPLRGGEDGAPAASRFARWRFGFALAFSWDAFRLPTVRRALKHGKPSTFTVSIAAMNIKKAPPMQS